MRSLIHKLWTELRERLLVFVVWLLCGLIVHTAVLLNAGVGWKIALTDALVSNLFIIKFAFLTFISLQFYQPRKWSALYIAAEVIALAVLVTLLSRVVIVHIFSQNAAYSDFFSQTMPVRMLVAALLVSPLLVRAQQQRGEKQNAELLLRQRETEKQLREAELAFLSRQLQPHFLFNSLNSVYALMGSRPDDARKMIQQLSEFLRSNLRKDDRKLVSFEEELHLLELYLNIERVRFGHRLVTRVEAGDEALKLLLPQFILQPVVENAIKFGLYDTTGGVEISITASVQNGMLLVQVENPFDAQTARPAGGAGFGLDSIGRRLQLIYGRNDLLETARQEHVFQTRITIPQPNAESNSH
jgi:two-component system, LytTR family, sensor kinase